MRIAQLLGDQNVDSALSPEITETVLEAADDGCTSAPAFRCMVYDGIGRTTGTDP